MSVLIAYAQNPHLNVYADVLSQARGLQLDLTFYL